MLIKVKKQNFIFFCPKPDVVRISPKSGLVRSGLARFYCTFKALKFNQPSYIRELLSFSSQESTLGLRSADDPYCLHEPRAIEDGGFANRSFSYI